MRVFQASIHTGLGDIFLVKAQLEPLKANFDRIELSFSPYWAGMHDQNYPTFLKDLWNLLFSEPPYVLTTHPHPLMSPIILHNNGFTYQKPELSQLLCKGNPLNIGEYVVLTTKIRNFNIRAYHRVSSQYYDIIRQLASKYKIVILGEKVVERSYEYQQLGEDDVYCIYNDIVNNIPHDRLVDLTIPALGITSPTLSQVQQDCLIMNQAKLIVSLGIGGNFCMAVSVGNTVGYIVEEGSCNILFDHFYPRCKITKDWNRFIELIQEYIK